MRIFDSRLPHGGPPPYEDSKVYRKTSLTRAWRIEGPFEVNTSEGLLSCKDGYLAMDARGYLYPVAAEEFEMIYEQMEGQ